MKIAFVANTCWNIYNFRKGLVHQFLAKGDEVLVLTPKDDYVPKIESWGVRWIGTPLDGTGSNPIKDYQYFRQLTKTFRKEQPDIVLSYTIKSNIYSSLAGKFTKAPVICNVSGLGTAFLVEGFVGRIALWLYRIAFRSAKYVFFQNADDRDLFTSHVKISEKKIGLLPGSGIDLKQFTHRPLQNHEPVRFLMISRVIIEKGVREYAEAAKNFKDQPGVEFILVGKFDENHARSIPKVDLDEWIEGGVLKYINHSDNVKDLIEASDVVVLPSYREGTPRTLLEGAAMGRPLLASEVPGCREVVKDGFNGFLFKAKNSNSLVDKIKLFLSLSKEERKELGNNSRKLVEETFDEKIVIDAYQNTICRIIEPA